MRSALAVLATGVWINASEFLRNEILLKDRWVRHYAALGLRFPSSPSNKLAWAVWGFLLAIGISAVSRRFSSIETAAISWLMGFVLMWIAVGNLGVLPPGLLVPAVPLSIFEAFVAAHLCQWISPRHTAGQS